MRVCLTVQGEQPISSATSKMERGSPSARPGGHEAEPAGPGNAPGWPQAGPGRGGQWGGQYCPPLTAENPRKCAGLRAWGTRAFGVVAELFLMTEFGTLMAMVVLARSLKQSGNESPEEGRQVHVQVPEEGQH